MGKREKEEVKRPCIARDSLLHGSRERPNAARFGNDLCTEHAEKLKPHHLFDGVLYVDHYGALDV